MLAGGVIEVGGGTGYWAWLLRKQVSFDSFSLCPSLCPSLDHSLDPSLDWCLKPEAFCLLTFTLALVAHLCGSASEHTRETHELTRARVWTSLCTTLTCFVCACARVVVAFSVSLEVCVSVCLGVSLSVCLSWSFSLSLRRYEHRG